MMIYLTVLLFVEKGKESVFHEYENLVLPLLSKYRGKLIYRIRPEANNYISSSEKEPYEIHLLSFETEKLFEAYIADKVRVSFNDLAKEAFETVFVIKGRKI